MLPLPRFWPCPPAHVIFDCDGVLVDSEAISNEASAAWATSLGWPMRAADARAHFLGLSDQAMYACIAGQIGHPIPPAAIAAFEALLKDRFAQDLKAIPGAVELVKHLFDRHVPLSVASSGQRDKVRTNLAKIGILDCFAGRTHSANDVAKAKPAPDLYLRAAHHAGVAPASCIAIEDSPNGVMAAVAAGMAVIGFAYETSKEALLGAGAHLVGETMAEIGALLDRSLDQRAQPGG